MDFRFPTTGNDGREAGVIGLDRSYTIVLLKYGIWVECPEQASGKSTYEGIASLDTRLGPLPVGSKQGRGEKGWESEERVAELLGCWWCSPSGVDGLIT